MEILNLTFGFKTLLFDSIDLVIPNQGLICVTGESGCGKTTLLKIIDGQIKVKECVYEPLEKQNIYFADQYATFDNNQSIEQVIRFYCEFYHKEYNEKKINEIFSEIDLTLKRTTLIKKMSSGQRKRLSIALAIYIAPPLIILDEPTSSLDLVNKIKILKCLKKLSNEHTVFISSHDDDVEAYCDCIYYINNQKLELKYKNLNEDIAPLNVLDCKNKINYYKLSKFQGKKMKVFLIVLLVMLIFFFHTIIFEVVYLHYQSENTLNLTEGLSQKMIYWTYENVDRQYLPIDYNYNGYVETDAIVDKNANSTISNIKHVKCIYPYYQLLCTGYNARLNDVDSMKCNVVIKTKNSSRKLELNGNDEATPSVVPIYKEEQISKNKYNFIDDITAEKLDIKKSDLPATIELEVGVPICMTKRNDTIRYYENNKAMDTNHKIVVNEVIYDKKKMSIKIDKIISEKDNYNYYGAKTGGGSIYININELENYISNNLNDHISERITLYDDLNEEIIAGYTPTNYVAFVDEVKNVKKVDNAILKENKRIITYSIAPFYEETINLRNDDNKNRMIIIILYGLLSCVIIIILLYRFNKSYLVKKTFYDNLCFDKENTINYIQANLMKICTCFCVFNILFSMVRVVFNEELFVVNMTFIFFVFLVISFLVSICIYQLNKLMLKRLLSD